MRVFLAEFAVPFWLRVADDLQQRYGITPVVWTALRPMQQEMHDQFPTCRFLDLADVKRNVFPEDLAHLQHAAFDQHCQTVWIGMAQLMFDQFHRWDRAGDFTTLDRTEHFYEALVFWNALIEQVKPDMIFFRNAPHAIYDLILLGLARSRGIRTLMYHHSSVVPYSLVSADLDRGCNPFHQGLTMARWEKEAGRQIDENEIPSVIYKALQKLRKPYQAAVPWYQLASLADLSEGWTRRRIRDSASLIWHYFKFEFKAWFKNNPAGKHSPVNTGSMAKEQGRSLRESYQGHFAITKYLLHRIRERSQVLKLRAFYAKLALWTDADPPCSFVYAALSFQPEATSNPHGGIFAQQLLMVNSLANALPEGWTLVVREHPAQFSWDFTGHVARNEEFYRLIASIPRVRLAPLSQDPFKLMDACSAVATLVGTTGWEALVRGRSVLIFGEVWYDRCEGAYRVRGVEDCRKAFSTIAAGGTAINTASITDFARELEFSGFQAGGELEVAPPEIVTTGEQIKRMNDMAAHVIGLPPAGVECVNLRTMLSISCPQSLSCSK